MGLDESQLRECARRAYERGRVKSALIGGAGGALPVLVLAWAGSAAWVAALAAPIYLICAALLWWGRAPGRAVLPGVAGGTLCASMISAYGACNTDASGISSCVLMSALGGLAAGAVVGWKALSFEGVARRRFVGVGLGVAALVGVSGCHIAGFSGVLGMSIALAASGGVAVLWPRTT